MATISVRIPKEMKEEMRKLKNVNWSEVIRQAIIEELRRERIRKASQTIDDLRAKSSIKWDSVAVIRRWREERK